MPQKGKGLQLREITPADLEEIARFILRISGSDAPLAHAVKRLSWILLENPARERANPLGWLLRDASGAVVGCMGCAPQKFCFNQKTFTMMMANSFYVDDRYRGSGASLFLKYLQLGRRYPLFVSSANATVAELWQNLGGIALANSDHEVFRILRWPPLLAEGVYRKTSSRGAATFIAALSSPLFPAQHHLLPGSPQEKLSPIHTLEDAYRTCANHRSDTITSCRDIPYLRWRYFSHDASNTRLFSYSPNAAENQAFMIGVRLQNRGYKQQIRTLQILDVWGESDAKMYLAIADQLCREYREQIDMLVFRCLDPTQQQFLTNHGFKVRSFAAPIAWYIDKSGLLPANSWYFVPADGDMFL
jgi:hypothetical protein